MWRSSYRQSTLLLSLTLANISAVKPALAQASDGDGYTRAFGLLVAFGVFIVIYLIPTIVAFHRGHPNRWVIALLNFFVGGTGLGWFGSLIWACGAVHKSETGSDGGESGLNLFVNDPRIVKLENIGPNAEAHGNPAEQLARLKQLHDQGVISLDELSELRKPWLSRFCDTQELGMPQSNSRSSQQRATYGDQR